MNDKSKEQIVAKLKTRLDDLDNQIDKVVQEQSLVCDHLRKLLGKERFLKLLKWRYKKARIEQEMVGQGWG